MFLCIWFSKMIIHTFGLIGTRTDRHCILFTVSRFFTPIYLTTYHLTARGAIICSWKMRELVLHYLVRPTPTIPAILLSFRPIIIPCNRPSVNCFVLFWPNIILKSSYHDHFCPPWFNWS